MAVSGIWYLVSAIRLAARFAIQRANQTRKQLSHAAELAQNGLIRTVPGVSEPYRDQELCFEFHERAVGHGEMVKESTDSAAAAPLSDVRWDRHSTATQLRSQPISLVMRKILR